MSNFPSALDNDASLYIARDNIQTRLSSAMAIGDTVAVVASPTGWVANMIATVESEQMLVTGVLGNVLTVTRHYGTTSAAAHASGRTFSNFVDSLYQSAAKDAIIAIETALGPNLSNLSSAAIPPTTKYNFTAQTPGGTLAVGANTITLNPMPDGITAASVGVAYLYITGGTGTAEAVPIIGWSATTVTVTCANTHSGAWTIKSASSGIQEAIIAVGNPGAIFIPAGNWNVYATIKVPASQQVGILGAGISSSTLYLQFAAGDGIYYDATTYALGYIGNFRFDPQIARTSGYDLHVKGMAFGTVENLYTRNTLNGYQFENCNTPSVNNLSVQNETGNALFINATSGTCGGFYTNFSASGTGINAILVQAAAGSAVSGLWLSVINVQSATNLINFNPNGGAINEVHVTSVTCDTWVTRGLYFGPGPGTGNGIHIDDFRFGTSSMAGYAVGIFSNWTNVQISVLTGGASGEGIVLFGAKNVGIHNTHISGDGSGSGGNIALLLTDDGGTPCTDIEVSDSRLGMAESGSGGAGKCTVGVSMSAAAHTVTYNGVRADGSSAAWANGIVGGSVTWDACPGINSAFTTPTIASITSNTITLGSLAYPIVIVSADGSGGVQTLTAPNSTLTVGYRVRIVATHASGIVFNTSGNIRAAKTLTTGQSAVLEWDGSKWDIS